jgi:membrane-bound serine protease (ClpP class)
MASALTFMSVIWFAARARRQPVVTGMDELLGQVAVATEDFQGRGHVRIRGEVWQAASDAPVRRGQSVRVRAMESLVLDVTPVGPLIDEAGPGDAHSRARSP